MEVYPYELCIVFVRPHRADVFFPQIEPSESLLSGEFGADGAIVAPPLRRSRRSSEADYQVALGCGPTVCTQIYCEIGPLADKQNVIIRVRTRVWVDTIKDVSGMTFYRMFCMDGTTGDSVQSICVLCSSLGSREVLARIIICQFDL